MMNVRAPSVAAAALLILLAATVQAQTPQERVDAAMERARSAGVPALLLQSKIDEGRAKGVPMDRIATAVEQRADALARAHAALSRGGSDPSALTAAADAVSVGVSEAVLHAISEAAPRERLAVAITALTELVALEMVPEEALQRVTEALARGPEALASLPDQAAEGRVHRGTVAGTVVEPAGVAGGRGPQVGPPSGVTPSGQRPGVGHPTPGERPGTINPGAGARSDGL